MLFSNHGGCCAMKFISISIFPTYIFVLEFWNVILLVFFIIFKVTPHILDFFLVWTEMSVPVHFFSFLGGVHLLHCAMIRVCRSASHFFPATILIFSPLFTLGFVLSICLSQFNLLSKVKYFQLKSDVLIFAIWNENRFLKV